MIPVYRVRAAAQSSRMIDPNDSPRRKRPWSPWQYLTLIVIAILIAVFVVRPVGMQITSVFQTLTDAFANQKR
jgi:ABC-type Fe3+ transport system permease subunit